MWRSRGPHTMQVGMQCSAATLEYCLAVPENVTIVTIGPSISISRCIRRRNENIFPHRVLCMNQSNIIHYTWKIRKPRCLSTDEWINVSPIKKKWISDIHRPWTHYAKWKKPVKKGHVIVWLYLSEMPRKGKPIHTERLVVAERWSGSGQWLFTGMRNLTGVKLFWR